MKQFTDLYVGELSEFRAINKAQRKKMAIRLKKLTQSSAFKKKVERSKLRVANPAKQRLKAAKMAKQKIIDKFFPKYKEMGLAQRVKTDQIIAVKYGKSIAKLTMKLMKVVKKKEMEKVKKAKEAMKQDA